MPSAPGTSLDHLEHRSRLLPWAALLTVLCSGCVGTASLDDGMDALQESGIRGQGLKGEYFADATLTSLRLTRLDSTLDFDWGSGRADSSLPADRSSAR